MFVKSALRDTGCLRQFPGTRGVIIWARSTPGVIVASPDLIAVEAVCHAIVGYHPLESPAVQIGMKDGLGTGDLSEIEILGTRLQDVYYPFLRGHMRYVQRFDNIKDMIVVSGFKVYSREVDDVLYGHAAVAMAATIGVPDTERRGSERVKVFIQAKPEHKDKVTEEEIIAYLQRKVPKYAVPKGVTFIDEMPLTGVQKVNKKHLREMELREIDGKTPD